jgi:hypothetical protein
MNDDIKRAVRDRLACAEDNLARARAAFRGQTLDVAHGASGQTRGEILSGYIEDVDRWKRALKETQS